MSDLTDQLDGARTILLEAPAMAGDRGVCTDLLIGGLDEPSVLFVTFTRRASACIDQLGPHADEAAALGVVTVGDASAAVDREDVLTETVSTASDLTGLGIRIGRVLSEWEPPIVVCFDSVTSMLQYVEFETAFEFVHALAGQLSAADARAHFHIDPAAHDDKHVQGLTSLVDAAITVDDGPTVRTRDVMN